MTKGAAAVTEIVARIDRAYPNATYALVWRTPWELLVGTILAAQATDATVNRVTASLFVRYPDVHAFAAADQAEVEDAISPCGLQVAKAKAVISAARMIIERFAGEVPRTMAEMLELPGVKRKSANVVLCCGYAVAEGIIVDTHVARLAPRIGLSTSKTPEAIERDLMQLVPRDSWITFGPALILHGREVCKAKAPSCDRCTIESSCLRAGLPGGAPAPEPRGR